MTRLFGTRHCGIIAIFGLFAGGSSLAQSPAVSPAGDTPFFDARKHISAYAGPGREAECPADLEEIRIGYFGPADPEHPEGGTVWLAARMAVEEANAAGGYGGIPFRLVPGWSENPWGTGVARVARMAYLDNVWAIIGSIDGAATHLAEQVVAKARLPLISPVSTDKTVNLANVAWMFSSVPGDHLSAPVLARALAGRPADLPYVLISATDHDSRCLTREFSRNLSAEGVLPRRHIEFSAGFEDAPMIARWTEEAGAKSVVILAGSAPSASIVRALRGIGFTGTILGGPSTARRMFLQLAGETAEGILLPVLCDETTPAARRFRSEFLARYNTVADFADAHAYDSTRLLVAAIRKVGPNRARIRDAVRDLSGWDGVSGTITWDALGANTRNVALGRIKNGRVVPEEF